MASEDEEIPEKYVGDVMAEALVNENDLAKFKRLMLAHPEKLRSANGGCSWLDSAARNGRIEFITFLQSLGVDINERDPIFNQNALFRAAAFGQLEAVRWLLEQGCEINEVQKDGSRWCTTLTAAASDGHFEIVKLLVEHGADINAPGPGLTALDHAVHDGQTEIADYLRSKGAKLGSELTPEERAPVKPTASKGTKPAAASAKEEKKMPKKK